ncbi:pentapeptide repeat-containing protein [Halarcobacter ebronensis]|uniref:pentapeptide repeat-containing protein n=1 Tax=Halarcobacter ebronensis TaxID=1462615 RepID=UPI003C727DDC
MKKSKIELENNTSSSINEIGLFKSVVNIIKEIGTQNYINATAETINSIENLQIEKSNGNIAWTLINRALIKTVIDLLLEKIQYFDEKDIEIYEIDKDFNTLLSSADFAIDDTFFNKPHEVEFVQDAKKIIIEFYKLFELEEFEINNILERFDSYFTYSLINEYRQNYTQYSTLKEIIITPFSNLEKKNLEWSNYNKWLEKQVNETIFDETFSLHQIYISLKAYYKEKYKNDQYQHIIVDIKEELTTWINKKEKNNALKIVRGGPGFGKSSFFKMFSYTLSADGHKVLFIPLHRINIDGEMQDSVKKYLTNTELLSTDPFEEDSLVIIFDGLDELTMQGKNISESAKLFVEEINRQLLSKNQIKCKLQIIISGRDVVIQQNESEFRKSKEIIRLLPYYLNENEKESFTNLIDKNNLINLDQRDDWWNKYAKLKNKSYVNLPDELKNEELDEITSQPLLNYLIALSYDRGEVDFSKETNLNVVYKDLLIGVYDRKYDGDSIHKSVSKFDIDDFIIILEEIGYCTWIGDGRKTSVKKLNTHFEHTGLDTLLDDFIKEAEKGIFSLLTSFYFKKSNPNSTGDETFEFTHKSFGEYLTAKKLVNEIKNIEKQYTLRIDDKRKKDGKSLEESLIDFSNLFGYKDIDKDLYKFIKNEIDLLNKENTNSLKNIQKMLIEFINYAIDIYLPMEKTNFKNTFKESYNASINAEKAFLVFHSTIAEYTDIVSKIDVDDKLAFGRWISKLNSQRDGAYVFISNFFNNLDLSYSILEIKDLYSVNFIKSNLNYSSLIKTNLERATLSEATLSGATLSGATLDGATLDGATLDGANLRGANLDGANLDGVNLRGADLSRANLRGATLDRADLSRANLSRANLRGATLDRATLDRANLDGANLDGANLDGANIKMNQSHNKT